MDEKRSATFAWLLYPLAGLTLLLPALINRYPLFIGDSWRYLRESRGMYDWVSSQFYSYLLVPLTTWSLWPVVVLQAAITVVVVGVFLRRVCGMTHARAVAVIGLLGLASSLGLLVSGIMTDLLFGLSLLAVATFLLGQRSVFSDLVMIAVIAFTAAAHPAALPILGFVALVQIALLLVSRWKSGEWVGLASTAMLTGAVCLALLALTVNNSVVWEKATPNPHSSVVMFAYLLARGDLDDELEECDRWEACPVVAAHPVTVNEFNRFLFSNSSVLNTDLGGATSFADRATSMVFEHIRSEPVDYIQRILSSGWAQLWMVNVYGHITAQMDRTNEGHLVLLADLMPGEERPFESSLQYNKELELGWYSSTGILVGVFGALATLAGILGWSFNRRLGAPSVSPRFIDAIRISVFLGGLYVLHAMVVGAATFPVHRYGGRVLWLLALAFWILVFALIPEKVVGDSGLKRRSRNLERHSRKPRAEDERFDKAVHGRGPRITRRRMTWRRASRIVRGL